MIVSTSVTPTVDMFFTSFFVIHTYIQCCLRRYYWKRDVEEAKEILIRACEEMLEVKFDDSCRRV